MILYTSFVGHSTYTDAQDSSECTIIGLQGYPFLPHHNAIAAKSTAENTCRCLGKPLDAAMKTLEAADWSKGAFFVGDVVPLISLSREKDVAVPCFERRVGAVSKQHTGTVVAYQDLQL